MSDFVVWLGEVRDDVRAHWLKALAWLLVVIFLVGGCVATCSSYLSGLRPVDPNLGVPPGKVIYFTSNGGFGYTPTRIVDVGDACVTETWDYNHWTYASAQACKASQP